MSKLALQATRMTAYRWLMIQAAAVIGIGLIVSVFQGISFAQSIWVGGGLCIIPNLIFARWLFAYYKASAARRIVRNFYIGELVKLALTGVLFLLAFRFLSINVIGCFIGYFGAQWAFWLAPFMSKKVK